MKYILRLSVKLYIMALWRNYSNRAGIEEDSIKHLVALFRVGDWCLERYPITKSVLNSHRKHGAYDAPFI
jgi:hypothetical protein